MEKVISTKERIIYESLDLFSKQGYDGVSMRDIAAAVGIRGASIYNHFKSKESILEAIFSQMTKKYDEATLRIAIPTGEVDKVAESYKEISEEELLSIAQGLFYFFAKDEFPSKFRKMLICEQYKNEKAKETLKNYFFDAPIRFQSELFNTMIKNGSFREGDGEIMVLHFYSPIYFLLMKNDIEEDFNNINEILIKHITQFSKIYKG